MTATPIRVDPDQLDEIAGQIDTVAQSLESPKNLFEQAAAVLQSDLIEDALRDFNADWSDKRGKLKDGMRGAADVLRDAASQFRAADAQLAQSVSGPPGPPPKP